MWDLPGPGLEPMSPELAGGFLTTAPPGKSHKMRFVAGYLLQCCLQCQKGETNPISYRELVKQTLGQPQSCKKEQETFYIPMHIIQ